MLMGCHPFRVVDGWIINIATALCIFTLTGLGFYSGLGTCIQCILSFTLGFQRKYPFIWCIFEILFTENVVVAS